MIFVNYIQDNIRNTKYALAHDPKTHLFSLDAAYPRVASRLPASKRASRGGYRAFALLFLGDGHPLQIRAAVLDLGAVFGYSLLHYVNALS